MAKETQERGNPCLVYYYQSADCEEGYLGTLDVWVSYTFTDSYELIIRYEASTDKPTIINLTNHTYFNLNLGKSDTIVNHILEIKASEYLEVDETLIPTGKVTNVASSLYDFTKDYNLGGRIKDAGGHDLTYVLKSEAGLNHGTCLYEPESGRTWMSGQRNLVCNYIQPTF